MAALRLRRAEGVVRERLERGPPPRGHGLEVALLHAYEIVQEVRIKVLGEERGVSEPVRGEGRVHHWVSPGLHVTIAHKLSIISLITREYLRLAGREATRCEAGARGAAPGKEGPTGEHQLQGASCPLSVA